MLTKKELTRVYNNEYFAEGTSTIEIQEHSNEKGRNTGLVSVRIDNCGRYLTITPNWKGSATQFLASGYKNVRYRKDFDCTALLEKDGKNYLFMIELKSGKGGVFDDAIYKYPGVYFWTKSRLDDFASHHSEQFEEVALIIYAPDAPKGETTGKDNNKKMVDQKRAIIRTPEYLVRQKIEKKYKTNLIDKTLTYIDGSDFGVDDLPLRDEYKMHHLKAVLWPVAYPNGTLDLDDVISIL